MITIGRGGSIARLGQTTRATLSGPAYARATLLTGIIYLAKQGAQLSGVVGSSEEEKRSIKNLMNELSTGMPPTLTHKNATNG